MNACDIRWVIVVRLDRGNCDGVTLRNAGQSLLHEDLPLTSGDLAEPQRWSLFAPSSDPTTAGGSLRVTCADF